MQKTDEQKANDLAPLMDAMVAQQGLAVRDEWRAGVMTHLVNAVKMAEFLEQAPVETNTIELACVFTPGEVDHD